MCMNAEALARSHTQWKEIIWQSPGRNRQDCLKYLTFIRQKKHSVPAENINFYEKQTRVAYWWYTSYRVVCSKHGAIKCFSTWITMSLMKLLPVSGAALCWDCHLYTSEHMSPEPKLSRRNEGENCFFPQASISKCTTNVLWGLLLQTHTNAGLWGVWARERCSGDDVQNLLHGPLSPQELPQLRALNAVPAPPCLHQNHPSYHSW